MNILGISAYSHNRAVCLVQDGEILAVAGEEHPACKGHDFSFFIESIACCLQQAGIDVDELDCIAFDCKPFVTFARILKIYLAFAPTGFRSFLKDIVPWIQYKFRIRRYIVQKTGFHGKIIFPEHHEILAASAFFPSPFREAAYLVVDGSHEWTTASYGLAGEGGITDLAEMRFPHSLGLLYSAFARYSGFKSDSDEDTLVEAASTGEPRYKNLILSSLMDLKEDGSFRLNMDYFEHQAGMLMANARFSELFGRPAKVAGDLLTALDMDLACSIRAVIEEIILMMVEHIYMQTGRKKLCLAGGVSRTCVAGGRILRESSFDDIWVQPASAGDGAASGAALFAWHQYLGNVKKQKGTSCGGAQNNAVSG